MISPDSALGLMQIYGLWLLAPVAILEGPIVTVIAGYMAHLGVFSPVAAYVIVVLADLVGDSLLYWFGHSGVSRIPARWRARMGLTEPRLAKMATHFHTRGGRTLVIAKLTHSLGVVALIAAGMSHMRFWPFLWYNLIATLPKSLLFLGIGYSIGYAYNQVDTTIFWLSLVPLGVFALLALRWYLKRRKQT